MNYNKYNKMADAIRKHTFLVKLIHFLNILFTAVGFLMYPLLLLKFLRERKWKRLFLNLTIPALAFFAVTIFRRKTNAKRPYQLYPIRPLIEKDKQGQSFPSRHTFSIMLIAGLWLIVCPPAGMVLLLCGAGLAAIRVIGGVHFFKDVFCGTGLGLFAAFLVYALCAI